MYEYTLIRVFLRVPIYIFNVTCLIKPRGQLLFWKILKCIYQKSSITNISNSLVEPTNVKDKRND